MNTQDLTVQQPAKPSQLILLFHGVGSSARELAPLGEALAPHVPDALIVSVQAPEASGRGWQWFSVQGITETNRPARVAAAMPGFVQVVNQWPSGMRCLGCRDDADRLLAGRDHGARIDAAGRPAGSPCRRTVGPFRPSRRASPTDRSVRTCCMATPTP